MQIDKDQIIDYLRAQGDEQRASRADEELPQQVDTAQHADLLAKLNIDPAELTGGSGGGLLGGITG